MANRSTEKAKNRRREARQEAEEVHRPSIIRNLEKHVNCYPESHKESQKGKLQGVTQSDMSFTRTVLVFLEETDRRWVKIFILSSEVCSLTGKNKRQKNDSHFKDTTISPVTLSTHEYIYI